MASTRNKNTKEDYCLQQHQLERQREWILDSTSRKNDLPAYPCYGINNGTMPSSALCNNSVDIENYLFGISANNFINPVETPTYQPKQLANVKFFDRVPLFVPQQPVMLQNQRPFLYQ